MLGLLGQARLHGTVRPLWNRWSCAPDRGECASQSFVVLRSFFPDRPSASFTLLFACSSDSSKKYLLISFARCVLHFCSTAAPSRKEGEKLCYAASRRGGHIRSQTFQDVDMIPMSFIAPHAVLSGCPRRRCPRVFRCRHPLRRLRSVPIISGR